MVNILRHTILLVFVWVAAGPLIAQDHAFVPVDDWAYVYIERLQRRGHLLELHPTALPYTRGEIRAALSGVKGRPTGVERRWIQLLTDEFDDKHSRPTRARQRSRQNAARAGVALDIGLRSSSGERLDPLRPDAAPADPTLQIGLNHFPNAALRAFLESGRAIAHAGLRFDLYYRDDPDGLDAANRLITRNDETYIGYNGRFASVYLGRIGRHWGRHGEPGSLLSRNPVSIDQVAFRLGGEKLSWQGLLGELDSVTWDQRFTGTAGADSVQGSIRRYLATHRIDWRPSRSFGLSVMESALYSSSNSGPSIKFLNPLLVHAFAVDGRPKNDENNGLVAGMLWAQLKPWTLTMQLMLDDFDFLGETGEPAAAAATLSLIYAGWSTAEMGLQGAAVTSRAYNTHQPQGRYLHLNRGLAFQFNDFIHLSGFASIYLDRVLPGLTATPRIDVLWQGEAVINAPYPEHDTDLILVGTPERTIRPGLEIRLQNTPVWWLRVDVGPNFVKNASHVDGIQTKRWTFLGEVGARVALNRFVRLNF